MKLICITPHEKEDYLASCVIEGLKKLNVEIIHTDAGNGLSGFRSDSEILTHASSADAVLAIWSKKRSPSPRFHLLNMLGKNIPVAYIDGSEYNCAGYSGENHPWLHPGMLERADFYFKRECMPSDIEKGVLPLPFAARDRDFLIPIGKYPRSIDIFCAFGQTKMDPIRGQLQKTLQALGDPKVAAGKYANDKYQMMTASSKICVNAFGGGEDCMRFWEILAAGTACFTQKFNIQMPHPFTDGVDMVEFETVDEFMQKAEYYLQHLESLERIALAGYQHLKRYHTTQERARYILESMGWDYPND